ncbi:uncharacterized protein [Aegilops tauschii subsp. strangulata]|uniref:uncharacterized protein n=1 Tax=Aegilops tauschii subsp. strangulata TaxID=200361 RepID=UPI001E1CAF28|nr:uncharacterized protein LOC123495133 [Aegilops tauschii subsp. strangulata]
MLEPYDLIRLAIEHHAGHPSFHFAATTGCVALLVLDSHDEREVTMAHFPAKYAGIEITLLRPEETDNRATTRYDRLVELEAKNYPLELWHPNGANFVFGHFGVLCCVDNNYLNAGDFTVMWAFLRVEGDHVTPDGCILRLPPAQVVDVKLRVVKTWAIFDDQPVPLDADGDDELPSQPHVHAAWRWNRGHIGPCPGLHGVDAMPPPSPREPSPPPPAAQPLHARANFLQPLVGGPLLPPAAVHDDETGLDDHLAGDADDSFSPAVEVSNSFSLLALDKGECSQLSGTASAALNSDDHEATVRRIQGAGKRATDAAKLRRSRRLAEKEGGQFVDMTTKAMRAKARRFDLQQATAELVVALDESGLTSTPDEPVHDAASLAQIALICGAEQQELDEVSSPTP